MEIEERRGWFDERRNVTLFLRCFWVFLGLLLAADFFIHKHPDFSWEGKPLFYAAFGYLSGVLLIFAAKLFRRIVKRDEDYYDR